MFTEQLQYINPPSNIMNKLNHVDILEEVGSIVALTAIRSELYLNHWKWSNYGLSSNTSIKLHIVTGFR